MPNLRRSWPAVVLVGAIAGCTDPLSNDALPSGTYRLVAVDGAPLPFRGPAAVTLRGSIAIGNGTYTLTQTDSALTGGTPTEFRSDGHWALTENALVLHDNGGRTIYLGVVVGFDTLRLQFSSRANTYARQ